MEQSEVDTHRALSEADYLRRRKSVVIAFLVIGTVLAATAVVLVKEAALSVMRGKTVAVVAAPNGRYEAVVYRRSDHISLGSGGLACGSGA